MDIKTVERNELYENSSNSENTQLNPSMESRIRSITLFEHCDFSPESVAALQFEDVDLKPIVTYLLSNELPDSQKLTRTLLLQAPDFIMVDNLLFHARTAKAKRTKDMSHYQLVIPKVLIKTVVQLYHDSPISAHCGITETIDRMQETYYFTGLAKSVTHYIQSCEECQRRKVTKLHTKSNIVSYRSPSGPFQVWQIDLFGPLPTSAQGSNYIFTALDMFSKYLFAVPMKSKDALTVATVIFQLFTTFGTCHTIISDQGTEFMNACMAEVCRQMHITQQFTPSVVHHCLGACERTHRQLSERLTPYLQGNIRDWDSVLPAVIFSINCSVNSTVGYSPYEIIFARRPQFPLANIPTSVLTSVPKDMHTYLSQQLNNLKLSVQMFRKMHWQRREEWRRRRMRKCVN